MFVACPCSDSLVVMKNVFSNICVLKCSQNLREITETLIRIHGRSPMKELVYYKIAGFQAPLSTLLKISPHIHI